MVTQKENIKGLSLPRLEKRMVEAGHPPYRARQLFQWLYQKNVNNFDEMSDLSKSFRSWLSENFVAPRVEIAEQHDSDDGTIKFLVRLQDGEKVESVFIPTEGRNTLCVSTQVGCKMACAFCATGYQKFTRDLKTWEIVDQLKSLPFPAPVTNIVFMGMGEPFDNYENVLEALEIFRHPMGCQIGKRHITVSTVGLIPQIQAFVDADVGKLAISLHGTTDEQRTRIMPMNKKYPLAELLDNCRKLNMPGRLRITWEYLMIDGINDTEEDAHRLAEILRGIPSKVNLLAYNENHFVDFKRPPEERVLKFQRIMLDHGYTTTYRRSRGRDIAAACGQLHHASATRAARLARMQAAAQPSAPAPAQA
ncbi:23S rRNA (adenine(2503)-C(2))-methyltransferase RlmN [bacterium]|nr:23S rRNA (adenine(2503)-C(2))-methyltransferase RlmN [bacterium]